jgi:hypothetical protein
VFTFRDTKNIYEDSIALWTKVFFELPLVLLDLFVGSFILFAFVQWMRGEFSKTQRKKCIFKPWRGNVYEFLELANVFVSLGLIIYSFYTTFGDQSIQYVDLL